MVGWHHRLNGHGFGWTPGVGDGQGGMACCSPWGCKESDNSEQLNWTEGMCSTAATWLAYVCKRKECFSWSLCCSNWLHVKESVRCSVMSDSLRPHGLKAHQAPLSMDFSRQEYWSGLPFTSPGNLPNPGIKPGSLALQADSLPSEPPGKPPFCSSYFFLKFNVTLIARTLSWNIFSGHQTKYSLLGFFDQKKDNDQNLATPLFSFLSYFFLEP